MTNVLANLHHRSSSYPLVVSHPLNRLLDALAACEGPQSAHWSTAYLCLRDAAEGVARLIWAVLVRDVFALMERLPSLASLGEEAQAGVQDVLSTLRAQFTMGSVSWLVSRRVWQRLGTLEGAQDVPCARDLLPIGKSWMGPLDGLKQWRNTDIAHGCLGDPARLAPLFDLSDAKNPFAQLVALLEGLDGWLTGVQARDGLWPGERDNMPRSIASVASPISWTGEGERLWLLEGVSLSRQPRLLLRGILTGRLRTDLPAPETMIAWAAWFSTSGGQRTETGRPLIVDQRSRKRLAEVEESVAQRRDVEPAPLLRWLDERADKLASRICVVGRSGSGKTRLLRAYADVRARRADQVVLRIASARDYPITTSRFASDVNRQLEEADGVLLPGHGAERLTTVVNEAQRWWSDLTRLNPTTNFALVIDGLDETASRGNAADILEMLPPDSEGRITTILGYRTVTEVEPGLRTSLERIESTADVLNLDTFYESPEGHAVLLRYLEVRHPNLKGHVPSDTLPSGAARTFGASAVPIREAIVAASAGRFLYVFHLARALETGILTASGAQRWPEADRLYVTLLTHLEALTGHHRGYVTALRRLLLTLAHAECPLNDFALCELLRLTGGPTESVPTPDEDVAAWLLTVFSHARDLIERRRVSGHRSDEELSTAWWVAQDDVEAGDTQAAWVQRIAHASLRELLRDGELPPGWEEERLRVRESMQSACALQVDAWIALPDDFARAGKVASMTRYALLSWLAHSDIAPDVESDTRAAAWADALPPIGSMVAAQRVPFWNAVLESALSSETLSKVSRVNVRNAYGRLLEERGEIAAAGATHDQNLAYWLSQPMHPSRAGAWTNRGSMYFSACRPLDAVREYAQAMAAMAAHIGLPNEPTVRDLIACAEVLEHRPYLREYATAVSAMGHAYLEAHDLVRSRECITLGIRAQLALAGILGPSGEQLVAPIAPDASNDLAESFNYLGRLHIRSDDLDGALEVVRTEYLYAVCAAGFHPAHIREQIATHRRAHPFRPLAQVVLPCVRALYQVAFVLGSLNRHDEAREVLDEALALLNELEVPEPSSGAEMRASGRVDLFELYGGLSMQVAQDPDIPADRAAVACANAVRVFRKLAFAEQPLDPDALRHGLASGNGRYVERLREALLIQIKILDDTDTPDDVTRVIDEAQALSHSVLSICNADQIEFFLTRRKDLDFATWLIKNNREPLAIALLAKVIDRATPLLSHAGAGMRLHSLDHRNLTVASVVTMAWIYVCRAHQQTQRHGEARNACMSGLEALMAVSGMSRNPTDAALAECAESDRTRPVAARLCGPFAAVFNNLGACANDLGDFPGALEAHVMEVRFEHARLNVDPRNPEKALEGLPPEECETLRSAWVVLAEAADSAGAFDTSMRMWALAVRAECARITIRWPLQVANLAAFHARDQTELWTLWNRSKKWFEAAWRVGSLSGLGVAAQALITLCQVNGDTESESRVRAILALHDPEQPPTGPLGNRAARRQRRRGGKG